MSDQDDFVNPRRFPKNVEGPFYTTGCISKSDNGDPEWCGDCLWCGAPEAEAPTLLAPLDDSNLDTYFVRQPESSEEVDQAINAMKVCCVDALRYGGRDKKIISKLDNDPAWCDYVMTEKGSLVRTLDDEGHLTKYAFEKANEYHRNLTLKFAMGHPDGPDSERSSNS